MIFILFFLFCEAKSQDYYERGLAYFDAGRYTKAAKYFKKAVRLEPYNATYYYMLGLSYEKLNRITDAINEYKAARILGYSIEEKLNMLEGGY